MIGSPNSYFTAQEAAPVSIPVFIITLGGSYEVPQADIIDPGQITFQRPVDFSDLTSGDHTFTLNNQSGIYSPGRADFIWVGTTWYRKAIKIELGYKRPSFQGVIDKITIYEGLITEWKVKETKDYSHDAPSGGLEVEVTSRDHVSLLAERQIGMPDTDGNPQPLVYGTVFKDLQELKDLRPNWSADVTIDVETGDLTQFTTSTIVGTGTVAASNTEKFEGTYSVKSTVTLTNDSGTVTKDVGADKIEVLATFRIKVTSIPASITMNEGLCFCRMETNASVEFIGLYVNASGNVTVYDAFGPGYYETNLKITNYLDAWARVSIAYRRHAGAGTWNGIRIYWNGDCIWESFGTGNTNYFRKIILGLDTRYEDNYWEAYFDKLEIDYQVYMAGYYLPGAPYIDINRVFMDGAIFPKQMPGPASNLPYIAWLRDQWKMQARARQFSFDDYDTYPTYGVVDCIQLGNLPRGSFFAEMVHDTTNHPVDIIDALLDAADLTSYIDTTNFSACKTAMPDDIIGCYFTETTVGQAISAITKLVLYDLVENAGKLCLIPYAGAHLGSSSLTLNRSNCFNFEQKIDMSNIKTGITAKWGWFDRDSTKYYRVEDAGLKALLGDQTTELDFSYGADVSSDDGDTAMDKADLLKNRLCGGIDTIVASGFLPLARLELGDGVTISNTNLNASDLIYEVVGKVINMTDKVVEITANRYEGE